MPLPEGLPANNLIAVIDANDRSLAWIKDLARNAASNANTIPKGLLTANLVTKNEVFVCWGERHPLYNIHSDNVASFDAVFEINEFGTNFDPTGSRPITTPIDHWKATSLSWSIGGSLIDHENEELGHIERDQLFGTTLLQKVLETYEDGKYKLGRGFLLHQRGSHGGTANQYIAQLEPLYREPRARTDLPSANGPSPRKRRENTTVDLVPPSSPLDNVESETPQPSARKRGGKTAKAVSPPPTPVQVILPEVPTTAAAPGVLYPTSAITGFNTSTFSSPARLKAVQLAIFDSNGDPILPSQVPRVLTPGTVVRARLAFGAWKPSEGNILRPFLRAQEIYVLGDTVDSSEDSEVISDSECGPSPLEGRENPFLLKKVQMTNPVKANKTLIEQQSPEVDTETADEALSQPKDAKAKKSTGVKFKSQKKEKGPPKGYVIELLSTDDELAREPSPSKSSAARQTRKRKAEEPAAGPSKKRKTAKGPKA